MYTIKLEVKDSIYEHIMFLLKNINKKEIRIITNRVENKNDFKSEIKKIFNSKDKDLHPFEKIDDPILWQKEQRDNW